MLRGGEGGSFYSPNRSVPAINKYGNIDNRLLSPWPVHSFSPLVQDSWYPAMVGPFDLSNGPLLDV